MSTYVYRYIDTSDNQIRYVGIVYGNKRSLSNRIKDHHHDTWYTKADKWLIQYFEENNRTDAEYYESHLISLYSSMGNELYNVSKINWGISKYLSDKEKEFKTYAIESVSDCCCNNKDRNDNYCIINGKPYYRLRHKVGRRKNSNGQWTTDYKLFYGKSKKEAEQKYIAYINQHIITSESRFSTGFQRFLKDVFLVDCSLKDSTKTQYINSFHAIFDKSDIFSCAIEDVNCDYIQQIINRNSSVNAVSARQAVLLLKKFYRYLSSRDIHRNITIALPLPKPYAKHEATEDIKALSDDELKRLIDETPLGHRLRFMIVLAIETGMGIGEILGLKYSDFSADYVSVNRVCKETDKETYGDMPTIVDTNKPKRISSIRKIPINDRVIKELNIHREWHIKEMQNNKYTTTYCFTTTSGKMYYKKNVRRALQRLCKSLGIEFTTFQIFRDTFGCRLANANVPIETTALLMGYSDTMMVHKYYVEIEKKLALEKVAI